MVTLQAWNVYSIMLFPGTLEGLAKLYWWICNFQSLSFSFPFFFNLNVISHWTTVENVCFKNWFPVFPFPTKCYVCVALF